MNYRHIAATPAMTADAARRIRVAVEVGSTDRDFDLLVEQVLADLAIKVIKADHLPTFARGDIVVSITATGEYRGRRYRVVRVDGDTLTLSHLDRPLTSRAKNVWQAEAARYALAEEPV